MRNPKRVLVLKSDSHSKTASVSRSALQSMANPAVFIPEQNPGVFPKEFLQKKMLNVTKKPMKIFLHESLNLGGTFAFYP